MKKSVLGMFVVLGISSGILAAIQQQGIAATPPPKASPARPQDDPVAKGKMLYGSYMCGDCHGPNGEGTDAAPNLQTTHLSADEIAAFLEKPSPDARGAGMPTIPADSPDLKPLVAFVVSLKKAQ